MNAAAALLAFLAIPAAGPAKTLQRARAQLEKIGKPPAVK